MTSRHTHGRHPGETSRISSQSAETLDSLISHYVAGNLPAPMRALVGAHVELKESGRRLVSGFETMAGNALEGMDPDRLRNRDAMLDAIFASRAPAQRPRRSASCPVLPASLVDFAGFTASDIPWRAKLPGLREVRMPEMDGCSASFYWIRPGRAMPHHTHEGSEVTLVLDGGFSDGLGHYLRGDVAAADETVDHRPVADDDAPCICFAVTTAPLKMTGSLRQLFSDIFGR